MILEADPDREAEEAVEGGVGDIHGLRTRPNAPITSAGRGGMQRDVV